MIALLPCPFCGGEPELERAGTWRVSTIIACGDCGCRLESPDQDDRVGASWNRREPAAPAPAPLAQAGARTVTAEQVREWANRFRYPQQEGPVLSILADLGIQVAGR